MPGPDETQATPPVEAPTFTGPQFDPTQDPAYESAVAADQTAYDTAVENANDAYTSSVESAAMTEKNSINAAKTTEEQAFAAADAQYQTTVTATNPTDLTAAGNTELAASQAARNAYATTVIDANAVEWQAINTAYTNRVSEGNAAQNTEFDTFAANLVQLGDDLAAIQPPPGDLTGAALQAAGAAYAQQLTDAFHKRTVADAAAVLTYKLTIDGDSEACSDAVAAAIATHD